MSASQRRIHTVAYLAAATLLASGSLGMAASAANAATAPASTTAEGAKTASQAPTNRSLHPRKASKGRLAVKVSGLTCLHQFAGSCVGHFEIHEAVPRDPHRIRPVDELASGPIPRACLRNHRWRCHVLAEDGHQEPHRQAQRNNALHREVQEGCARLHSRPYKNLTNCDFSAQALDNANFAKSTLTNASFAAASVRGANFGMANLTGVDFSNSLLARASFNGPSWRMQPWLTSNSLRRHSSEPRLGCHRASVAN